MADRFKEYKAYIPPKWAVFDDMGGNLKGNPKSRYTYFLPQNCGKSQSDLDGHTMSLNALSDVDGGLMASRPQRGGAKVSKSAQWANEMLSYVKQQEMKQVAREKTQEMQRDLKEKQRVAQEKKEKELMPPSFDGGKMPTRYFAHAQTHPDEVARYHKLLESATEANRSYNFQVVEGRYLAKQARKEQAMDAHLAKVDKNSEQAVQNRNDDVKRRVLHDEMVGQRTRKHKQEITHERDAKLLREHEKARADEERIHQRREQRNRELAAQRERESAESAALLAKTKRDLERSQEEWHDRLERGVERTNERLILQENARLAAQEQVVRKDYVGKAKAARDKARTAQLDSCNKAEQRRAERLQQKQDADTELLEQHKAKRSFEEGRVHGNAGKMWAQRQDRIERDIVHHHTPIPWKVADLDNSRTHEQLMAGLTRKEQVDAERERRRQQEEQRALDTAHAVEQRQLLLNAEQKNRFGHNEQHRLETVMKGAQRRQDKEDRTQDEYNRRQAAAEETLQQYRAEQHHTRSSNNEAKAGRIRDALNWVNVEMRQKLIDDEQRKEDEYRSKRAVTNAANDRKRAEQRASRDAKAEHMRRSVQETADERDRRLQRQRDQHEHKSELAKANKDLNLHDLSTKLAQEYDDRMQKTREAMDDREQQFLSGKEAVAKKDKELADQRRLREKLAAEEREHKSSVRHHKYLQYRANRDYQVEDFTNRTVDRLAYAYSRQSDHQAHDHSNPSFTPARAHTTSPGQ